MKIFKFVNFLTNRRFKNFGKTKFIIDQRSFSKKIVENLRMDTESEKAQRAVATEETIFDKMVKKEIGATLVHEDDLVKFFLSVLCKLLVSEIQGY